MKERIYPREKYLSPLRPFYDSNVVKVITGIRRSGKQIIEVSAIFTKQIFHFEIDYRRIRG